MYSLQALVCIIIYLQSSALMHSCYSYISTAISVSLQMGLHRSEASMRLNPIEQETRKRVFWVLQTMETYVTTLLGLPTVLDDEDIDQELPLSVEDELITAEGMVSQPSSPISPMAAVNAHIKLLKIQRRVVKEIYPRTLRQGIGRVYKVNYSRIVKFETELDEWFENIPVPPPSETDQPETLRFAKPPLTQGYTVLISSQDTIITSSGIRTCPDGIISSIHPSRHTQNPTRSPRNAIIRVCFGLYQGCNANRMACRGPRISWSSN